MNVDQRIVTEQRITTVVNGRLIQQGGGFILNNKLFDEYLDDRGCTKFRDNLGNAFNPITIYHVAESASLYVSTDKGLFLYNADIGEATCLSYELDDIIFMQVFRFMDENKKDVLIGFYPLGEGYGVRKITFDENDSLQYVNITTNAIPSGITWLRHKKRIDNQWTTSTMLEYYPICYKGTSVWLLRCTKDSSTGTDVISVCSVDLTDAEKIIDNINQNTLLVKTTEGALLYVVIYNIQGHIELGQSIPCSSLGSMYQYSTTKNISFYDQSYMRVNNISTTFMLSVDNNTKLLTFAFIVFGNSPYSGDYIIHHIDSDESNGNGINGGYVNSAINHRIYTATDASGYTNGTDVYATNRFIFASSTRLMDITNNRYATLMYIRANDKTNYSLLPSTNKTPVFTVNASIEINSEQYGNVISTDYDSVKGLYYIYTNSNVGIYFITTRQLTWATNSIMTRVTDLWSFKDITVIDGKAKEFVNGIMTTTAMNGPTFDQLYAEIDELRKRIAALESKIPQ